MGLDCSDWVELAAQLVNSETSQSSRFLGFGPHNPTDVIEEPQAYLVEMAVEQPKVKQEDLLDYRVEHYRAPEVISTNFYYVVTSHHPTQNPRLETMVGWMEGETVLKGKSIIKC